LGTFLGIDCTPTSSREKAGFLDAYDRLASMKFTALHLRRISNLSVHLCLRVFKLKGWGQDWPAPAHQSCRWTAKALPATIPHCKCLALRHLLLHCPSTGLRNGKLTG